jgi:hypothetical protein
MKRVVGEGTEWKEQQEKARNEKSIIGEGIEWKEASQEKTQNENMR